MAYNAVNKYTPLFVDVPTRAYVVAVPGQVCVVSSLLARIVMDAHIFEAALPVTHVLAQTLVAVVLLPPAVYSSPSSGLSLDLNGNHVLDPRHSSIF